MGDNDNPSTSSTPFTRTQGLPGAVRKGASIGLSLGQLEVTARWFFTINHVNTDRLFPPRNVVGASVEVVGTNVKGTTNSVGIARLATGAVPDGPQTIRLMPPMVQLSGGPAAVPTGGPNPPDFEFRQLDISVNFSKGQLTSPDPSVAAGIVFGDAYMTNPTALKVDWKPDWVKCKNSGARAATTGDMFQMIVLHRTGGTANPLSATLNEFLENSPDSAHYVVDVDGHAVKLVDESRQAFHADAGFWKGTRIINPISVGIEIVNIVGQEYAKAQIDTVIQILKSLEAASSTSRHRVVGHSDVEVNRSAPQFLIGNDRPLDPGPEFDWPTLEAAGLAPNCDPSGANLASSTTAYATYFNLFPNDLLQPQDNDANQLFGGKTGRTSGLPSPIQVIHSLQKDLSTFGYSINANDGMTPTGLYDAATQKAVERFQRRVFAGSRRRAKAIDGHMDMNTALALISGVASVSAP